MKSLMSTILQSPAVRFVRTRSKKIILPGFEGVPLYDVVIFFFEQINKVGLNDRAAAVSFNILMAIPAATIFLFTLIPYMPVSREITRELLDLVRTFTPDENTYGLIAQFLNDFLNTPRTGLLSFGFVIAVFYASNAVLAIMRSFNRSLIQYRNRGFLQERWTAIRLTTVLILLLIATIILIVFQGNLFRQLMAWWNITSPFLRQLIYSIKFLIVILLLLYGTGILYKYAPAVTKRWRLASPGAIFATFLVVLLTYLFSYWVNNFGAYNKVYGSIGTILILMLLVYLNSLILLIGYELNVSIHSLKAMAEEREAEEAST